MTNSNRRHSGAQNFDDELSVTNSKRSGVLTDSSSSQTDAPNTQEVQVPQEDEDTSGKKRKDEKKDSKKRPKS